MSVESFMKRLLDGDEVEWMSLEDIAHFQNAKPHEKFVSPDGDIALLTSRFISTEGRSARWINKADVLTPALENDVALVMSDLPNGRALAKAYFVTESDRYAANQRVCLLRVKDTVCYTPKLLYYVMNRNRQLLAYDSGYDQTHLKKDWILQVQIPIPCPENPKKSLEIQAEIVRILDAFTAMTAELTAELSTRQKQYNYYRDKLLRFEEGEVEWRSLAEISQKISSGGTPKTGVAEYYDGDIPWLRTQEVNFREIWDTGVKITESGVENSSAKWIPENCVIVAMYGATVGRVGINKIPMTTNQACANINIDENVANYRYVFHFLTSQYEYIRSLGTGSQTNINAQIVRNLKVPIPFAGDHKKSLAEQARIVAILDKFDTLTTSITEGLPREIELRQQQYEYYRDLLLSFPESEETEV